MWITLSVAMQNSVGQNCQFYMQSWSYYRHQIWTPDVLLGEESTSLPSSHIVSNISLLLERLLRNIILLSKSFNLIALQVSFPAVDHQQIPQIGKQVPKIEQLWTCGPVISNFKNFLQRSFQQGFQSLQIFFETVNVTSKRLFLSVSRNILSLSVSRIAISTIYTFVVRSCLDH